MAFPEDPLGLRVEIRTGTVWTDITADVRTADPITHARGIRNSGTSADPATCPLKIDNKDGRYSPRNPVSPYYGLIGRNTPVRLWLPSGPHFLDLDGTPGSYASTPDDAALDITGDLDVRVEAETSWHAPGAHTLIGKWDPLSNQRSYLLRLQDGLLYLSYSLDGVAVSFHARPLPDLPPRAALRATLDVDNGVGGRTVTFYWAPSLAGPWTQFSTPVTIEGPISMYAGMAPLTVAPTDLGVTVPRYPAEAHIYAAEVRSGIGGTVVASPNFEAQPLGSSGFTDSAGRVWTLTGAAIADRQERFVGEIAKWPQKWTRGGKTVWTTVEAAGILRRYGQGQKALDSTLRRRIPSGNPIAYWPMEEAREATRAYSPIQGVTPAAVTGLEFAGVDTLPSSKALPKLSSAATLSAIVPTYPTPTQWQVEFVYTADDKAPPAAEPWPEVISVSTTGTVRRWWVGMRAGSARILGYDSSGAELVHVTASVGSDVFHGWVRMRLWVRESGGTVSWRLEFQDVGGDAGGTGATFSGTAGRVTAVTGTWGAATEGWSIGHLAVLPTAQNSLYTGSDNGYTGEAAWARMLRLANEENIPLARVAGPLATERVGPQRPETLLTLLQKAAEADGGMLLEDRARTGLVYRDRSSLYTQEPALTLVYGVPGLAPPLEPVDDDDATRNDITITRDGGSSARAVLEEGPLSVQPPPDGIGVYDESLTLSLADDVQPTPHAYWHLHLGTYDGARYPSVRVLLHKAPHLIPQVLALREGDLLRLQGLPPWVAYGDVDLIVTGYSETLLPRTWEITFTCEPAGPWMTAKADHPVYGKADTDGCVLSAAATDTATALDVVSSGLPWTTDPAEMPIVMQLGGEEVSASAIAPVSDTFTRAVASGWGTSSGGQVWATAGGAASDRSVDGARGVVTLPSAVTTVRFQTLVAGMRDCEIRCRFQAGQVSTGASLVPSVLLRYVNGSTYYRARVHFGTGGGMFTSVTRDTTQVGGTPALPYTYVADAEFEVRVRLDGHRIRIRVWPVATPEPAVWHQDQEITTNVIAEGAVGLSASAFAGNTNVSPLLRFDNFEVVGGQRLTVVRSVNGVIKAHGVGEPVQLAHPAIASL
ncbi:hypothetical protein AB0I94_02435 [Streptomyces sp. NPDC050147]|uniref:hypothetical protein n=1 Tax=Streptomyces sp. NPDC050147 TaxID=3155513 RepID=UPI0034483A89